MSSSSSFIVVFTLVSCFVQDITAVNDSTAAPPRYYDVRRDLRSRPAVLEKIPPGGGGSHSRVNISVSLTPIDILDVDDVRQVVSTSVYLRLEWNDPALAWSVLDPTNTYRDPTTPYVITLPLSEIWSPVVTILNGATTEQRMIDKYQGDVAYVQFNGTVSVWAYLTLDVISKMDLTAYPFDTQRCRVIVFISSTNPVNSKHEEDPTLTGNATRQLFAVGAEWTFEGQTVEEKELPGLGQYTIVYLEYTWTITRKTTYFVISFIVPIVLTSYMNTVVFVIPVESGERISYLVTIFVSTAVLVSFCTVNVMPQGLDETPLIMYLVLGIMVQSAALLVLIGLLLHRYYDHEHATQSSDSDKNSERRIAANERRYAPSASHELQDIHASFALSNRVSRNGVDRQLNTKEYKDNWQGEDGGETLSPRDRAKKLDIICFIITFVITTVYNVGFLVYMRNVKS